MMKTFKNIFYLDFLVSISYIINILKLLILNNLKNDFNTEKILIYKNIYNSSIPYFFSNSCISLSISLNLNDSSEF